MHTVSSQSVLLAENQEGLVCDVIYVMTGIEAR